MAENFPPDIPPTGTLIVFSLWPTRDMDKPHLRRTIFSVFLSNNGMKSPITKNIENNIFEEMTY